MSALSAARAWSLPAYTVIIVATAVLHNRSLAGTAAQAGAQPSLLEAVLNVSGDPYVLIPWMLMAWILRVAAHVAESTDPLVLLRYGSRLRWMLASVATSSRDAALLMGTTLLAAAVTSLGMPLKLHWSETPWEEVGNALLAEWTTSGMSPLVAIIAQSILTVCGLLVVSTAAGAVALWASPHRHLGLVLVLSAGFLVPLLLVRLPDVGALGSLVTLAIQGIPGWPITPILLVAAANVVVIAAVGCVEGQRISLRPVSAAAAVYAVLVAVLLTAGSLTSSAITLEGLLLDLFYGAGVTDFRITTYTVSLLIFLGPAYLFLLRTVDSDLPRLPQLAVRHGRVWPWLRNIAVRALLAGVALVLLLMLVTLFLAAVTGRDLSAGPPSDIWHQFLVNGALQVYVSAMVVILPVLLTGSDIAGIWMLLLLVILGVPPITHGYFPSALNMLGLLQSEISPWRGTVVLLAGAALVTATAYLIATRPAPQRLITGRPLAHR